MFLPTIELRERIEKAAKDENRSMSNFVVNVVKEYLDINYPLNHEPEPEPKSIPAPKSKRATSKKKGGGPKPS